MELFVFLKICFRYSGYLSFNGSNAQAISIFLRLFGILSSLYVIITSMIFVIFEEAALIEIVKSFQGGGSLGYIFAIHVIFTLGRKAIFEMMNIFEKAVERRKLTWNSIIRESFGA